MKGGGYRDALGYHAQRKAPSNFEKPPLPNARTSAENQASATTAAPASAAAALEEMKTGRVGAMMMERSGTNAKTNAAFYISKAPHSHKTEAAATTATATMVTARAAAATNVRYHHHGRTMAEG